ncbi:MAG TPA: FtsX-like permease family protein [Gaiellaceae bacterium]|nr:FtsX-like permease family protein [Gaiellaceae bacterium]
MTPPGPWRLIAKRTLAVWPLVLASFGAVLLAATLLAAGPMYAGAAAQAGLERKLADADAQRAGLDVTSRAEPAGYPGASGRIVDELRRTLPGDAAIHRIGESDSVADEGGRRFVLAFVEGIDAHATLDDGRWPQTTGGALEAAVSVAASRETGLAVGDVVELSGERNVPSADVRIVGVYTVVSPEAAIWWNDELMLDGVRGRDTPTYGPLVVPERTLLATVDRFRASWRVRPEPDAFTVDELRGAAASIAGLEERLGEGVPRGVAPPVVSTSLPAVLDESRREVGVARSGVLVPLAQLALLAAYGLVFVAALIRRRRRREDELLLTRGAHPSSLALASALEALLLAALAALAAPWAAALAIELVSAAGPLASARLELEPQVGTLSYALALAGAAVCLIALVLPALRHDRDEDPHDARPGFFTRTGLDIALLVAAAVALWQLRAEGAPVVAREGELDVLLVAVPAIGILAGAVLAGRLLPPVLALVSRAAAARPGAVPVLAARRLARTAVEHRPAAVLLVAALAIGTFAAAYARTWDATQRERAALTVGADVLVPDDRRSESFPPIGRANAFAATEGVGAASPLVAEQLRIGGDAVRLVAVDAGRTPVAPVGATAARQASLLRELADRRPQPERPHLPASATSVDLTVQTTLEPLPPGVQPPRVVRFGTPGRALVDPQPRLALVIRDADGLLHHLAGGPLRYGTTRLSVALAGEPRHPLELAGIELSYSVPAFLNRSLVVELSSPLLDGEWTAETSPIGAPLRPALARVSSAEGLTVTLETGASEQERGGGTVVLRPERRAVGPVPAIAGTGLLEALGAKVGNVVELDAGSGTRSVELIGSLANFATVAEGGRFLVVDLPTLLAERYASQEVVRPDFWTLDLEPSQAAAALASLSRPPLAVGGATSREQLEVTLANDPLAVATSGALWLGFFAAALFAVAAFAVAGAARSRKHLADASLLGGLGLDRRGTRALLVLEDAILAVLAAAIGVGIGAALALLVLPAVAFTETGRAAVPPPVVDIPWATVGVLAASVLGVILLAALARAHVASRASIAAELRAPAR